MCWPRARQSLFFPISVWSLGSRMKTRGSEQCPHRRLLPPPHPRPGSGEAIGGLGLPEMGTWGSWVACLTKPSPIPSPDGEVAEAVGSSSDSSAVCGISVVSTSLSHPSHCIPAPLGCLILSCLNWWGLPGPEPNKAYALRSQGCSSTPQPRVAGIWMGALCAFMSLPGGWEGAVWNGITPALSVNKDVTAISDFGPPNIMSNGVFPAVVNRDVTT